jgi:class 3 adenylate cyclase/predicted ATPase
MKCPRCEHENPAGMKFCGRCAAPLMAACAACGAVNPPANRFCGQCAAPLSPDSRAKLAGPDSYTPKHLAEKILTSKSALEGERKQVTVLLADLKGSMELLADRDPEDARQLLDPVLEHMMEAVHRYEGTVNQVMGDGIMALFGAPLAHEDHAVRACYAALRMHEAVGRYAEDLRRRQGVDVQIRVGLNSGEVVVRTIGSDLHMDYTAVGQTTHLAARMEQLARPGTTLITPATLQLVENLIEVQSLGPTPIRGLTEPVEVHELLRVGRARTRLQAAAARGLTRFVGRDAEMRQLQRAAEEARAGHGQIVAVVGEPGVGKSRLYWELTRSHRVRDWLVLESGSVSYGKATPYLPLVELLKAYFRVEGRDEPRTIKEKVTGKLLALDRALEPDLTPLLSLLDAPVDDESWSTVDPRQRRRRTLDAGRRLLLRESQVQPLVLIFEDLHWIDTETQAFLDGVVDSMAGARILLLTNYRTEYQPAWGQKTYYRQIRLDTLHDDNVDQLFDALLGADPSIAPLRQILLMRTEGNPLFLEESVRTLVETRTLLGEPGAYRLAGLVTGVEIPATVQSLLAARIDRLPAEDKRLLQIASAIGKDVPVPLLAHIVDLPEGDLQQGLGRLQAAELLYQTQLFPDLEYTFKHALTHEVAYQSLLRSSRQGYHRRIARALEEHSPAIVETQSELIAHHYTEAGLSVEALPHWHRAGTRAAQRSASVEAIEYLTKGLHALQNAPDSPGRLRQELDLQLALGPMLMITRGYGAPEVVRAYARARELCRSVGPGPELFTALHGLWLYSWLKGDIPAVLDAAPQLLDLAERLGEAGLRVVAQAVVGEVATYLGRFAEARSHMERGLALYDPRQHRALAYRYGGYDPGMACRAIGAHALWYLGYPDQALAWSQEAIALGRDLAHPPTLAFALGHAGILHYHRREDRRTLALAEEAIALSAEHGIEFWEVFAELLVGWALARQGRGPEGIERIQRGLARYRVVGGELESPLWLAMAADAACVVGRLEEGLAAVAEGLDLAATMGVRFEEAELHRLHGELLLAQGGDADKDGERALRRALEIAAGQQARSVVLRVAISLARLPGREEAKLARQTLAESYQWFTEGFDTADLREARLQLEEPP